MADTGVGATAAQRHAAAAADAAKPEAAATEAAASAALDVLRLADMDAAAIVNLLGRFGLTLVSVDPEETIPGSYWGDSEAGVIGECVFARPDTPLHSLLHEAGHLLVLPIERRRAVHTNATDSDIEEDATCYLQILLADVLPGAGSERLMADMDAWGYSFRLGSASAWFRADAEDARNWLQRIGMIDECGRVLALLAPEPAAV